MREGKVRNIYGFGNKLLLVASDRISAFDRVLPTDIPDKGKVLTQLSKFWFERLAMRHHLISTDLGDLPVPEGLKAVDIEGRSMLVHKAEVIPIECVVRGYLAGSGWKEYQRSGSVCGVALPKGLLESSKLPEPIFTPATKEETGHDVNISFDSMVEVLGDRALAELLRSKSFDIYHGGAQRAYDRGIIIADTKFEFGHVGDEVILIDEVLTPDSSRFWPVDDYEPGRSQRSYDKQFVRDWLVRSGWDKESKPPELPDEIVDKTRAKYIKSFELLTETDF